MSSGLYNTHKIDFDTTLDLTRLKPYGDTMNDGKVQTSFTLPVKDDERGEEAARQIAKKMGLPVNKFICASNRNNVLTDFFLGGVYDTRRQFFKTTSPSMDILISSNLERLIYRIAGGNPEECAKLMENLSKGGEYTITPEMKAQLKDFYGNYCSEEETKEAIREVHKTSD